MARIARVVVPNMPHHITQRGNRRLETFFCDEDYECYLELLAHWCAECGVDIWCYCLMPNHIHIIAVPSSADGLCDAFGQVHRRYTRHINFREKWRGHLWQGRFASFVMDDNHLLRATRYVELNPVKAGLVTKPGDYRWSSAQAHLEGTEDALVNVHPMLSKVQDWKSHLALGIDEEETILMRKHERSGHPMGSNSFIENIEKKLGQILRPKKRGPKGPWKHKQAII